MICPVCGCQQRKADVCVQCHAPLFAKVVKSEGSELPREDFVSDSDVSQSSGHTPPKQPNPPKAVVSPPEKKRTSAKKTTASSILVTTTQRVEGRRIAKYYGLIHTDVLIDAREPASAASRVEMHRKQIKSGVLEAMKDLRQEADLLKANAVVATTFDYQRIDSKTLLLSVIGTAVFLKAS
ncbi:MAG: heavy metal-binding domain-containing protein [Nitrospirae bacterium]|nr:heavy metal-binding domain-containing protein [Candidatus Manganitrophaceae bacterium]